MRGKHDEDEDEYEDEGGEEDEHDNEETRQCRRLTTCFLISYLTNRSQSGTIVRRVGLSRKTNLDSGEVPANDLALQRGGRQQRQGARRSCSYGTSYLCHRAISKVENHL